MPYINQERRQSLNPTILDLTTQIETPGELNYALTLLLQAFVLRSGGNYTAYNAAIGVLECAKQEFYRRWVAEYEDEKRKEHGDVQFKTEVSNVY